MKTFFKETEAKSFNQNEKIRFIFEQLIIWLQVTETSCKKHPLKRRYNNEIWNYSYAIYFNTCNFENVKNIQNPFPDIDLQVSEETIIIEGFENRGKRKIVNFKYQFAPDQILTIWNRLKRILK
jgi:hypothetical protein